jgi:hypothetical protein
MLNMSSTMETFPMPKRFHYQCDRFGKPKDPKVGTANFKLLKAEGVIPATQTRAQLNKHYTKKLAKNKAARKARRNNRK